MENILKRTCVNLNIVPACKQTKTWRQTQSWYTNGKKNECELYQRDLIEKLTGLSCSKTKERINLENLTLESVTSPMKFQNGYEYTEDFDGKQVVNGHTIYFNLKMVCDQGGAQTRTLREVYHFVQAQLDYLNISANEKSTFFVNILDGDACSGSKQKFNYLLAKPKYQIVAGNVFCGSMFEFTDWFKNQQVQWIPGEQAVE